MKQLHVNASLDHFNFLFHSLMDIEIHYDSFDRASLELKSTSLDAEEELRKLSELYLLLWDREFEKLYVASDEIFKKVKALEAKAFILQVAIAAAELQFNLDERKKWFRLWYSLEGLENSFYCQYLFLYHKANILYYEGNRAEAIKLWSQSLQLCRTYGYKRGQFRLLYFIGRAYHDLNFLGEAEFYYMESLALAKTSQALRLMKRINLNLQSVKNKKDSFNQEQSEIFSLIEKGHVKKAKKFALYFCRVRRAEGRTWGAESEWVLLCWVLFAENKMKRFFIVFDQIDDEFIKQKILDSIAKINKNLFDSNPRLKHVLSLILSAPLVSAHSIHSIVGSTSLKYQSEVKQLIHLLKESGLEGLSMEDICAKMWNIDYQPDIHAHRVYLLITKVRKYFGTTKSIINSYGGIYKIAPLLINKS